MADLDDIVRLEAVKSDCGLYHAAMVHRETGWRVISVGHWETAEAALIGGQAMFDQTSAELRDELADFVVTIPDGVG